MITRIYTRKKNDVKIRAQPDVFGILSTVLQSYLIMRSIVEILRLNLHLNGVLNAERTARLIKTKILRMKFHAHFERRTLESF